MRRNCGNLNLNYTCTVLNCTNKDIAIKLSKNILLGIFSNGKLSLAA